MFIPIDDRLRLAVITIVTAIVWRFFCIKKFNAKNSSYALVLFIIFFMVGLWRINQYHHLYSFTDFDKYNKQTITIAGSVNDAPTFKPGKQLVRVHPESVNGIKTSNTSRDVILQFSDLEHFARGDELVVSGTFSVRADFESDTGRIVQYRLMSYSRKIAGDMRTPKVITYHPAEGNAWSVFSTTKQSFLEMLNTLFIAPGSGLLAGMMIGDTSTLDGNLLDVFRAVGLIHIVVLSGYNITLVANFFITLFSSLGYYRRLVAAMTALIFFILVVGISQTAMRAGIMALCAFAARYYIRPYIVTRGIALALLIMVWISPYALLFDLSLQLSFLATIGIVYIFPLFQERFENLAESTFGEILLQTFAVNVMTLPIIIYQMGTFSPISFPINILVLGFVPWLTIGGFAATFTGMITTGLGKLIAFPVQIITDTLIRIAEWTARNDPFQITFPVFSQYWILIVYGIIFSRLVFRKKQLKIPER